MGADQLQGILVPALMAFPILQTSNPVRLAATQRGALSPALPVGSRLNKTSNLRFSFGNFPRVLLLFTILLPCPVSLCLSHGFISGAPGRGSRGLCLQPPCASDQKNGGVGRWRRQRSQQLLGGQVHPRVSQERGEFLGRGMDL